MSAGRKVRRAQIKPDPTAAPGKVRTAQGAGAETFEDIHDCCDDLPTGILAGCPSVILAYTTPGDLTAWWRLGDIFTFGTSVANALYDSSGYDSSSPRYLNYSEDITTERPTLGVADPDLGTGDDGAIEFNSAQADHGSKFTSSTNPVSNVTKFGQSSDLARSVVCRIKPKGTQRSPMIGRWGMDLAGSLNIGWVIDMEAGVLSFKNYNAFTNTTLTSPGTLTAGTWYSVAVTWDGTTYRLYLDGVLIDSEADSNAPGNATNTLFAIGYGVYDFGITSHEYFGHGSVDEVAFYRKVLTAAEIAAIHQSSGSGTTNHFCASGAGGIDSTENVGQEFGVHSAGEAAGLALLTDGADGTTYGVPSGTPTGAAGGALDGTYPNPGIAASVAGAGLAETTNVLSVNVDGSTIEIATDTLQVKDAGITAAKLAATAAVKTIKKTGSTALVGDVTLTGGSNVTLTQAGQDITIAATVVGSGAVDSINVTADTPMVGAIVIAAGSGIAVSQDDVHTVTVTATGALGALVGCCAYNHATQSITQASLTTIALDTEAFDTSGFHDNTTNNTRITVPSGKDGYYLVTGQVRINGVVTGKIVLVTLRKNGAGITPVPITEGDTSATGAPGLLATAVVSAVAGDYFEVAIQQGDTTARSTIADQAFLSAVLIGT